MSVNTLRLLNLLGFVLVIALNILANALPINGMTTGELSALYPNRFVPAGFTFGIWGVIYLALLGFTVFQFFQSAHGAIKSIGIWFFVSCLANASWILAWHYQKPLLSLGLMLLLLFTLIKIYLVVRPLTWSANWLAKVPFQLYLGWISVATIANATAVLVSYGWAGGPLSEVAWASIMVVVAAIAGLFFAIRYKDILYNGVLLWAFYGIYARQASEGLLQTTLYIAASALIVATLFALIRRTPQA
ncbi:tryptophan-rich sensory protein [Phaeodactylibacter xiamenensis]|uniref:tryptophan-rich sensory protein n=1 Tax=Phaeodactylibacter xiamenensis TaxID=1524460 RepID=UPI003CCB9E55